MPVSLICFVMLGNVFGVFRFVWYIWNCDGGVGMFSAYHVGLNVVTLSPGSDWRNIQLDSQ